ncbi:MAG: hypothetical protein IKL83_07570 [Muribaculaceae bacterium]|nr:hypothetical protein [Muribaculaceae bacterium]
MPLPMEDNHNNEIKYDETGDFVCYLLTLDRGEHAEFIKRVAYSCGVPRSVVYSWKYMCCRIPTYAKEIINKIAGVKVFRDV